MFLNLYIKICIFIFILPAIYFASCNNSGSFAYNNKKQLDDRFENIVNCWQEDININNEVTITSNFPDLKWWYSFNDSHLTDIIDKTLTTNHEIIIAKFKEEQSLYKAKAVYSKEFPQLYFRSIFARVNGSENFLVPQAGQSPQPVESILGGGTQNLYILPFSASYELDLFRIKRLKTMSALKDTEIMQLEYKISKIISATEAASAYFSLVANDQLLCLNLKLQSIYKELISIRKSLYDSGYTSIDKYLQAKTELSQVEKDIEVLKEKNGFLAHFLSVIQGTIPLKETCILRGKLDQYSLLTTIPITNPLELIKRRPDILVSEKLIEKSGLDLAVTKRELYPNISLLGSFTFSSSSLDNLFDWSSNANIISAFLSQPIYTGGLKVSNIKFSNAKCKEYLENYYMTVLNALKEVEDIIVSLKSSTLKYKLSYSNYQIATNQLMLSEAKFNHGYTAKTELLEANINLLKAELQLSRSKEEILLNYIKLYKVLGGGY